MIHLARDAAIQHRIGLLLAKHLAAANLLGRTQIAREVHKRTGKSVGISPYSRLPAHVRFDDSQDINMGFSVDLPNEDAVKYLRELTPVTKATFDGLTNQYQAVAFTISGTSDVRLIEKIRDALVSVAAKGGTADDFEAAVKQLTDEAGVEQLNAFTLDTAFNTAMQKAYSLGRYEQMRDPTVMGVLPYRQYWTVGDDRVRPELAVLDGFTARAEDPVWQKIYPPNGFNCRCSVAPILKEEAPKDADEPGMERLPALAMLLVPQPGFSKVFVT